MSGAELDPFSLDLFVAVLAGAALLAVRRPAWGVLALALAGPFDVARAVGPTTITLEKCALGGLILGLLFRRAPLTALRRAPASVIAIALAAVVGATVLSIHAATFRGAAVRESFKALEYLLVFCAALVAIDADPDDALLQRGFAAVALIVAAAAFGDYVLGAHSRVLVGTRAITRIAGPLEGPNQLAGWLGIVLPVLFATVVRRRDRLVGVAFAVAAVALVLTLSRSGIAAGALGMLVVAVAGTRGARRAAFAVGGVAAAVAAVALVVTGAGRHVLSLEQIDTGNGLATRGQLWHAAIALWKTHPLLGIGAGNYELRLSDVGLLDVRTHANNYYLQSLVEGGIPLALAGVAAMAAWILAFARARSPFALGAFGAGVAFAFHQCLDDLAFYPKVGDLAWCVVGAAAALVIARSAEQSEGTTVNSRAA
jgi:O-antigen ligase